MVTLDLKKYGPLITSREKGELIYKLIFEEINKGTDVVEIEMGAIVSMTTFCAKQIFGQIYVKLGAAQYAQRIKLKNASDDVMFIIRIGVTNAVKENKI